PGLDWADAELPLRPTLDLGIAGKVTQGRSPVTQQLHAPMIGAQTDKAAGFGPSVCRSGHGTVRVALNIPVTCSADRSSSGDHFVSLQVVGLVGRVSAGVRPGQDPNPGRSGKYPTTSEGTVTSWPGCRTPVVSLYLKRTGRLAPGLRTLTREPKNGRVDRPPTMTDAVNSHEDTPTEERQALRDLDEFAMIANRDVYTDPAKAVAFMSVLIDDTVKRQYRSPTVAPILINMTSALINAGMVLDDHEALAEAENVLVDLIANAPEEAHWKCRREHNLANATDHAADLRIQTLLEGLADDKKLLAFYHARSAERVALRTARFNFAAAAKDNSVDQQTRALTNLANMLSTSGRWLEA